MRGIFVYAVSQGHGKGAIVSNAAHGVNAMGCCWGRELGSIFVANRSVA